MIWQDIVLMVVGFGFSVSLIPTIIKKQAPSSLTCILTIILLSIDTFCLFSLNLILAASSIVLSILGWLVLLSTNKIRS